MLHGCNYLSQTGERQEVEVKCFYPKNMKIVLNRFTPKNIPNSFPEDLRKACILQACAPLIATTACTKLNKRLILVGTGAVSSKGGWCLWYEAESSITFKRHCSKQWRTQKFSEGWAKSRHNHVMSQINFRGCAEGTITLGGRGACPRENFAKWHLKIRIFVHSGSTFRQYCFYIFLFLGFEGVAMAQWPPPPYASGCTMKFVITFNLSCAMTTLVKLLRIYWFYLLFMTFWWKQH